jgi:hypothetical protein
MLHPGRPPASPAAGMIIYALVAPVVPATIPMDVVCVTENPRRNSVCDGRKAVMRGPRPEGDPVQDVEAGSH